MKNISKVISIQLNYKKIRKPLDCIEFFLSGEYPISKKITSYFILYYIHNNNKIKNHWKLMLSIFLKHINENSSVVYVSQLPWFLIHAYS